MLSYAGRLRRLPFRAVQRAEDRGSENVPEGDEDRLPRSERQVDDSVQIDGRQRQDAMRWHGGVRLLRQVTAPFHADEADT